MNVHYSRDKDKLLCFYLAMLHQGLFALGHSERDTAMDKRQGYAPECSRVGFGLGKKANPPLGKIKFTQIFVNKDDCEDHVL
jgi:hypothetical protein